MTAQKNREKFELSEKKRELLDALLSEEGLEFKQDRIPHRRGGGPIPLSFAQQRLWFFDQFEPGSPTYNLVGAVSLKGQLDLSALRNSFREVVRRHEALRTRFEFQDGRPMQLVTPYESLPVSTVNLTLDPQSDRTTELQRLVSEECNIPFDLSQVPLCRAKLVRVSRDEHVLILSMHHIVSDAWSMNILVREMAALYEAFSDGRQPDLPNLPIQYADFALWQREQFESGALNDQLSYWLQQLSGEMPVVELPTDRPRPISQTYNGSSIGFAIDRTLAQSVRAVSHAREATTYMTLLSAFAVLLSRYTSLVDLAIGTPIANRNRAEIEPLIGFFTNTLVIRTDLSGDPSFEELLGRVRETALGAYSNQDLPFEYLVERLHPNRDLSHSPLVQVLFAMQNAVSSEFRISDLTITPLKGGSESAKFDLTLYIDDSGGLLEGTFEYNTDLFDTETIIRMAGHFQTLLEDAVANPSRRLSDLQLLTDEEERQILLGWNGARADYPSDACAHELFEAQVIRCPDAVAAIFEDKHLSYSKLNRRANQLARRLRAMGLQTGAPVGLLMKRSIQMAIAVLATLKAGAACLPLDPSYPDERLGFMLADSGASLVISEESLASSLPKCDARIVYADALPGYLDEQDNDNFNITVSPEQWAYVIFTSGSTGEPKGIAMPHRALVNLADWHRRTGYSGVRTLQYASLNFDVSFQEMFATWHVGGTVVMIEETLRIDGSALGDSLQEYEIERFHLPVVILQRLAAEFSERPDSLHPLREMMVGGEQLQITPEMTALFAELKRCALYNHYGPSESHVVTFHLLSGKPDGWPSLPPLGRPISNVTIYVLDRRLHLAPVGVPGEIYIGGACLAHGYIGRSELTAERFMPDPFGRELGSRLYKTGDLGRFLPNGDIEYLGRNDFQVKLRGMRIELGEIESVLRQHENVSDAVVMLREGAQPGDKRLVAYVVGQPAASISARDLKDYLREKLSYYMVPATYVAIDQLPMTPSGKVNRMALPAPDEGDSGEGEEYQEPEGAVEKVIAGIWEEVLGKKRVGAGDNFFEIGGHSLVATQVMSRVRETLRVEVGLRKLFEEPTVRGFARALVAATETRAKVEKAAEILLTLRQLSEEETQDMLEARRISLSAKEKLQ